MRNEIQSTFFNTLLLSAIIILPGLLIDVDPLTKHCIYLIVDLLIALYLFNNFNKVGAFSLRVQEPNWKNLAILSPVLISFLGLPISFLINPEAIYVGFGIIDGTTFFLEVLELILSAFIEETIFRLYFQRILRNKVENRGLRILACAGIFALFDVIQILFGTSLSGVLILMISSFLFGIILSAIMEYGHCIYFCYGFHFLYKFIVINSYGNLIIDFSNGGLVIGLLLTLVSIIYLVVIYFAYFRKKDNLYV